MTKVVCTLFAWYEESANQMWMDSEYLGGISVDIDSKK